MRSLYVCVLALSLVAVACGPKARQYTLQGQVTAVSADRREATIQHEEIRDLMPAMTMPYRVHDPKLLAGIAPGDLINATLVITPTDAWLAKVTKVGSAPLARADTDAGGAPSASFGAQLLRPGEAVPDATFVDQEGKRRSFSSFRGSTVVLTFIYTRCPLPTFCPLMDRNFAKIQDQLAADPSFGRRVHLVTVSFDPAHDTPPVLKQHGKDLHADFRRWTFLTGDRQEISRFAARLGVSVMYEDDGSVTHNLRTAIIGPDGRLVKVYTGNDWTPAQVMADVRESGRSS